MRILSKCFAFVISRLFVVALFAVTALLLLPPRNDPAGEAVAQSNVGPVDVTPGTPNMPISFRDRLVVGLRAISNSDVAFVDAVVSKVQAGRLPQRLVDQTFFWARDRAGRPRGGESHRPIIYFRPAMTLQARQLGVTL